MLNGKTPDLWNCNSFCCCSVTMLRPILWDPTDCSTPCFLVLHHLLELAQTHVHWVGDAIQPSHPLSFTFSPLPSIFPSIRVFSNEAILRIWWPKDWSFHSSISPSDEYSGLVSLMSLFPILGFQTCQLIPSWFYILIFPTFFSTPPNNFSVTLLNYSD